MKDLREDVDARAPTSYMRGVCALGRGLQLRVLGFGAWVFGFKVSGSWDVCWCS